MIGISYDVVVSAIQFCYNLSSWDPDTGGSETGGNDNNNGDDSGNGSVHGTAQELEVAQELVPEFLV